MQICTYLAVAIGFILNDAARRTFSAFHKGRIDIIFNFINGNINNRPLICTQLLAESDKVHLSCGHHGCEHLQLCKHLEPA